MRTLLGTAAQLLREIYATISIRVRRAPSGLWVAWAAAVVLVVAGLAAVVWIGGGSESADVDESTPGQPGTPTTAGAAAAADDDDDDDRPMTDVDPDQAAGSTITDELSSVPADDVAGHSDDGVGTSPDPGGEDDGRAAGTTAPPPSERTTTTRPPTTPPDRGDEPQGLLSVMLKVVARGP